MKKNYRTELAKERAKVAKLKKELAALRSDAQKVVDKWDQGDLASAVRELDNQLMNPRRLRIEDIA